MNINVSYSDGSTNAIVINEYDLAKTVHELDDKIKSFVILEVFKQKGDVRPN